jgi:fumarate reductase (CoM/CoB) subunit A
MKKIYCDVLVIGGGAAGSRAAYEAKRAYPDLEVTLVVAGKYGASGSSNLVASEALGINAPFNLMNDGDNPDIYHQDMVTTGGGLADFALCRIIADQSGDRVRELQDLGVDFDRRAGRLEQKLLSGCSKARSLTCGGSTGLYIVKALQQAALAMGLKVYEETRIVELLQDRDGRICGAYGLLGATAVCFVAGAVILATGGAGRIFRKNVNPPAQEGDGWAMAYQAGARLVNMEFFQIGPAVVNPKIDFIIHSHMWRLKPKLRNTRGVEFLSYYCPLGVEFDRALDAKAMSYPFSVRTLAKYVDIAIFKEIMAGNGSENDGVYFDVTHSGAEKLQAQAPITYATLKKAGTDLAKQPIELGLVAQNFNGGILIDGDGYTGVPGLFAAGEVTGGVHGSDRPGGNNLTDTQVFGYQAGLAAARYARKVKFSELVVETSGTDWELAVNAKEREILRTSEDLYYREMTIVRTAPGLRKVLDFVARYLRKDISLVLRNRLLVGKILAMAMLAREESRGTHYREDYPDSSRQWEQRIIISKGSSGEPELTIEKFNLG